jgi:two-component system response regulator DctR
VSTGLDLRPKEGPAFHGVWNVLIVEDSPSVADIHRLVVDATPGFRSIATRGDGEAAYDAIVSLKPDIAIIDLTMPGGDGLTLLRRVRTQGLPLEAIVVTASRDPEAVAESLRLGALDYLVKPFATERLQASLAAFAQRTRALRRRTLRQDDIDLVNSSGAVHLKRVPRGLRRSTLLAVRRVLGEAEGALAAEDVGARVGVARVTARRYLEYLEVIGAVTLERESTGPGRPRNRYRSIGARA